MENFEALRLRSQFDFVKLRSRFWMLRVSPYQNRAATILPRSIEICDLEYRA